MNRREAIARTSALLGGTIIGAEAFLAGCTPPTNKESIAAEDIAFLDEVGETILPATSSSPGAKEAHIGEFMKVMVSECYEEKDQVVFEHGIVQLNDFSNQKHGQSFLSLTAEDRHTLLVALDGEAKDYEQAKAEESPSHYFTMMKQLTLLGYFTSEPGATKALRYVPVPGRFDGCIDYKKGEKAWAT